MNGRSLLIGMVLLAGCATPPDQIKAADVSAGKYAGWSCAQLAGENAKISATLDSLSATQREAHSNDVVGVMLIGLPVGSMASSDGKTRAADISRIKGEKNAIYAAQKKGGCLK